MPRRNRFVTAGSKVPRSNILLQGGTKHGVLSKSLVPSGLYGRQAQGGPKPQPLALFPLPSGIACASLCCRQRRCACKGWLPPSAGCDEPRTLGAAYRLCHAGRTDTNNRVALAMQRFPARGWLGVGGKGVVGCVCVAAKG